MTRRSILRTVRPLSMARSEGATFERAALLGVATNPLALGLLALGLLTPSCDSPVCAFGGDCFAETPTATDSDFDGAATAPLDGQWIVDGAPSVERMEPRGQGQHPQTPILVLFSESISPDSLIAAPEPVEGDGDEGDEGDGEDGTDDEGGNGQTDIFDPFGTGGGGGGGGTGFGGGSAGRAPIELIQVGDFESTSIDTAPPFLVGDGRVLVLLPTAPLPPGEYEVRIAVRGDEGVTSTLRDLTGDDVTVSSSGVAGSFSVAEAAPAIPKVVFTFPEDGSTNESEIGEVIVAFDRPMDGDTINGETFAVTVGGEEPTIDPDPLPAVQAQAGILGTNVSDADTRVFVWQSADPITDTAVPLGLSASVELALSPAATPILDDDANELAPFNMSFQTAPFGAPTTARLASLPPDAIGLANLGLDAEVTNDERALEVEVTLRGGRGGDSVDSFFIGLNLDGSDALVAKQFDHAVPGSGNVATASIRPAAELIQENDGVSLPTFADGPVSLAVRAVRGDVVSPVRLLDLDPLAPGLQELLLDGTPPTLIDLVVPGAGTELYLSDLRDLVVSGFASEDVGAVEVSIPDLDANNGVLFPAPIGVTQVTVPGTQVEGDDATEPEDEVRFLFVAAPVPVGVLAAPASTDDPIAPLPFTLRVFDRALNGSETVESSFRQVGAVGNEGFTPGDPLQVRVHDVFAGLAPLAGAQVSVFVERANGDLGFSGSRVTNANGFAQVGTSSEAGSRAIVVVSIAGYDVFSFHGVTSNRIDVPLRRTGVIDTTVAGSVLATSSRAQTDLLGLGSRLTDSRRPDGIRAGTGFALPWVSVACTGLPQLGQATNCSFMSESIQPGRLGAQTFFAGRFDLAASEFNADQALQSFELLLPLPTAAEGEATSTAIEVDAMLTELEAAAGEAPVQVPGFVLQRGATNGIDFNNLVGDPDFTGDPIVAVEALAPGIPGVVTVGFGNTFDDGLDWNVRAVHAGVAGATGALTAAGTLGEDLMLRLEVRDTAGNRAGRRPRLSSLGGQAAALQFRPTDVAAIVTPAPNSLVGGEFDIRFDDVLPDGQAGLYRVVLEHPSGLRWEIYTPDRSGQPTERVSVLDVAQVSQALPAGTLECSVAAFSLPDRELSSFLWTDIEREYDLFSESAPIQLVKP